MSGWIKCSDRLPNVMPNIEVEDSNPNLLLCCKHDFGVLTIEQGWYSDLAEEEHPKFFTMWINNEWTSHDFRTDSLKLLIGCLCLNCQTMKHRYV